MLTLALVFLFLICAAATLGVDGFLRPFTRLPEDGTNFGPTGARLWATYIANRPGMEGSFEFIHKVNVPRLFSIELVIDDVKVPLEMKSSKWYLTHSETIFEGSGVQLFEQKFITWDDCAVDVVALPDASRPAQNYAVNAIHGGRHENDRVTEDWSFEVHGARVFVHTAVMEQPDKKRWVVASGLDLSQEKAKAKAQAWLKQTDPLSVHKKDYQRFFEDAPVFKCSDAAFEKMWQYRWYLIRRNLADPRHGKLRHPLFYEGRSAKMSLDAWAPKGWEFSKLIPFSTGFHLLEGRWSRDASAAKGELLNLAENQREDGLFPCVYIDSTGSSYTDFVGWSAWQLYLVHPDRQWLAQVAPAVVRQVDATLRHYDADGDFLPVVTNHNSTGKEYQPSFFHKPGYPDRPRVEHGTPLERVDAACYLYLNAQAASFIMGELGNAAESQRMSAVAEQVRNAVLEKMWDTQREFFYDIDAVHHDRIPVENVVGFDPFFADIASKRHSRALDRLSDPKQFAIAWPVPSTTKQSPVYAPDASWKGVHVKGNHGAMWNGPTWPFTNSTVLMGVANATLTCEHKYDALFAKLLRSYTQMCFCDGNLDDPVIYEHYNPETGRPISQEEDYYHSSWIDLIVRYVAGITPLPGGKIEFHPIDCGLDFFSLHGVHVAGHRVDVDYSRAEGYTARIDGRAVK